MSKIKTILPLNRVEGDLEIHLELENGTVIDAQSAGTMYRGFENLMIGRAALDGLVITPRICGICTTSHLNAAVKALDMLYDVMIPANAKRIRLTTLLVEQLQNDFRHAALLFMPDFTTVAHKNHPLYEEAVKRYSPLKGSSVLAAIRETRNILEIVSILGGQWPHSSFMVPGGVVSMPSASDVIQSTYLLKNFRKWYEQEVLGCSLDRWAAVKSKSNLLAWLDEAASHQESELGFFIRFATAAGFEKIGAGCGNYLSFGISDLPPEISGENDDEISPLAASGFYTDGKIHPLNQKLITEDTSHSWFAGIEKGRHPFEGETIPYATGSEDRRYSWAKAPRYDGMPAETGPLAEMLVASHPLFTDLINLDGPSVFNRELARLVRSAQIIPILERCLEEMAKKADSVYQNHGDMVATRGFGLIEAPRGALGHWVIIQNDHILSYQVITPTAWNASPRDSDGIRGPWEEALVGTQIEDPDNPVEAYHIIRSFDPCQVCAVHTIEMDRR